MVCPTCGSQIDEGVRICSVCGANLVTETVAPVEETTGDPKAKVAKLGFIFGIIAIATSIIAIGAEIAIPGIILSAIGKNSPTNGKKAKIGLILSIIALVIGTIIMVAVFSTMIDELKDSKFDF